MTARRFFPFAILCVCSASAAWAQQEPRPTAIAVQQFTPTAGVGSFFTVEGSWLLPTFQLALGFVSNFADDPLVAEPETGAAEDIRIIDSQLGANALLAIGLGRNIELGFDLPLTVFQQGENTSSLRIDGVPEELASSGLGDFRLVPKVRLYGTNGDGLGLLLAPVITLPTGDKSSFLGGQGASFRPLAIVAYRKAGYDVAANVAYRFRSRTALGNLIVDDEIAYALGAHAPLPGGKLGLVAELSGALGVQGDGGAEERPMEGRLGAKAKLTDSLLLSAGLGAGLSAGFGSPDVRFFAGISWVERSEGDNDLDGILNKDDACREEAEDRDGFEDEDGCPDLDNDNDGIPDGEDNCPLVAGSASQNGCPFPDQDKDGVADEVDACREEAEDKDGFEDEDGCPDPDNDQDGAPDVSDACQTEQEDKDGFEDEDGCPDIDNDQDGISDEKDTCPLEQEDKDGFKDEDGCPDIDNDNDGVPDLSDKCPNEAETFNGEADEDGCPDSESTATLTETKVEITQTVLFASDSDTVDPASYKLLDGVAAILKLNPQITKLRVEGHTDNQGSRAYNLTLSEKRATAVMKYLVETAGIAPERLVARGYGPDVPITSNKSPEGRAKNRRVEFVILEKDGVVIVPDDPPPAPPKEPKKAKTPKKGTATQKEPTKKPTGPVPIRRRP